MALFRGAVSLLVNVAEINDVPGDELDVDFDATVDPLEFQGETIRFPEPFVFKVRIQNTGTALWAEVRADGKAERRCARCLEPVISPIEIRYSEVFRRPNGKVVTDDEVRETVYQGDVIDLSDGFTEQLLLQLPMKAICNEACRGLCPQCGQNLNYGQCDCRQDFINPKMAKLLELLDKPSQT